MLGGSKFSVKSMKTLLVSHEKMKLTGGFKNGDRFYAVTGGVANTPLRALPGNWD